MPGGRPTTLTHKIIHDAEDAQRLGLTFELTIGYLGVPRSTFYKWLRRGRAEKGTIYAEFVNALQKGASRGAALSLARLQRAAKGGAVNVDMWLLERCRGYTIQRTAQDGADVAILEVGMEDEMSPEEETDRIVEELLGQPSLVEELARRNPGLLKEALRRAKEKT